MNIGSLFRPLSYPFMIPSAGLVEGMGSLCLMEYNLPQLLPPYLLPFSIPPPRSGRRLPTPGPPPLSPVTDNDSSIIPDSFTDSSPNPFYVERRTFHAAQGPDGLVWTNEERAALQAFLSHYTGKEGVNVPILEAGEGDRSLGGSRLLPEGAGFRAGGVGA